MAVIMNKEIKYANYAHVVIIVMYWIFFLLLRRLKKF